MPYAERNWNQQYQPSSASAEVMQPFDGHSGKNPDGRQCTKNEQQRSLGWQGEARNRHGN
jgi:hypothetical protein